MKMEAEEKAMWLEDWQQSGKSAWSYAKANGLVPQTFCNWVKRAEKKAGGFVEIPMRKESKHDREEAVIIEKGDVKIHVPISVWAESFAAIMEKLRVTV